MLMFRRDGKSLLGVLVSWRIITSGFWNAGYSGGNDWEDGVDACGVALSAERPASLTNLCRTLIVRPSRRSAI